MFRDSNGRRIGVLLMDTQGAWDSKMTKDQSATIFGLTALLSSKLVYNIQNRVEEDKIENLDYFTSFAEKACGAIHSEHDQKPAFGLLQFLIRDWSNYKKGWDLASCKEQMDDHIADHMDPSRLPAGAAREKVERLQKCFSKIDCFGLTHPGLDLTEADYDGSISSINQDFLQLLDSFVEQVFGQDFPCASTPLGSELTTRDFVQTVKNFGEAFANTKGMGIGLRDAFVKVQIQQDRAGIGKHYKKWLEDQYPSSMVVEPGELDKSMQAQKEKMRKEFQTKLSPYKLKPQEEEECLKDLMQELEEAMMIRKKENDAQVDGATVKVVATPVVGCAAWFALSHAWLLAIGGAFGAWVSMKKHASINGTDELCHTAVLKGVAEDARKFAMNRWKDLQAMKIAAERLEPNKIVEIVMGSAMKAANAAKTMSPQDKPKND